MPNSPPPLRSNWLAFHLLVTARAPAAETRDLLTAARTLAHGGLP